MGEGSGERQPQRTWVGCGTTAFGASSVAAEKEPEKKNNQDAVSGLKTSLQRAIMGRYKHSIIIVHCLCIITPPI